MSLLTQALGNFVAVHAMYPSHGIGETPGFIRLHGPDEMPLYSKVCQRPYFFLGLLGIIFTKGLLPRCPGFPYQGGRLGFTDRQQMDRTRLPVCLPFRRGDSIPDML